MTGINFYVCYYCKYIKIEPIKNSSKEICGRTGKYIGYPISDNWLVRCFMSAGCGNFEASGVPTLQYMRDFLTLKNPNAISIPTDEQATEESWDFSDKVSMYNAT